MITKLVLENWKTHKRSVFEFEKGTNVIVGCMGSGKTSMMDAISFALFGTFPALKQKKLTLLDVITNKPYVADQATVHVEFKIKDNLFKVTRIIDRKGKKTIAELRDSEDRLLMGPNPAKVTDAIEKLLKINYELFSRAIYSEQNQIDYFLKIPAAQRKAKIDELLNINKYESARKNITTLINRVADRFTAQKEWIEQMEGKFNPEDLVKITAEIDNINKELKSIEEQAEQLKVEKEKIYHEIEKLQEKKQKYDTLIKQEAELKAKINILLQQIEENPVEESKEELNSQIEYINKEIEKLKKIQTEIQTKKEEKSNLQAQIKILEDQIQPIETSEDISTVEARKKDIGTEIEKLQAEYTEKQAAYHKLEQQVAEIKGNLAALQKELEDASRKISQIKNDTEIYITLHKQHPSISEEISILTKEGETSHVQLRMLQLQKSQTQKDIEALLTSDSVCPLCGSSLTVEHKEKVINDKEKYLQELDSKISLQKEKVQNYKQRLEELQQIQEQVIQKQPIYEDYLRTRERIEQIQPHISQIKEQLNSVLKEKDNALEELSNLEENINKKKQEYERKNRETEILRRNEENKKKISEILPLQDKISIDIEELEQQIANKSIETLYSDKQKIEAKIKILELKREYEKTKSVLDNISQEITNIAFNADEFETKKSKYQELIQKIDTIQSKKDYLSRILEEKQKRQTELKDLNQQIQNIKAKLQNMKRIDEKLKIFRNALLDTQIKLRKQFLETTNAAMEEIWPNIYPYGDYTSIELSTEQGDYTLLLKEKSGEWKDVNVVASGGERSAAALVLRLALSLVLAQNLSWVILDEPTHNLDTETVQRMTDLFKNNLPHLIEQIFIITHDEMMRNAAGGALYELKRDKNIEDWVHPERITLS